ncbi:hypothetical protein CAEBREN_14719 [Caenorhabditis brenneri]|uniref:R3H domain-containing protein n=1 Tax=Caenorhabditis brenneri TaxID=135651 RepID=G0P1J3_CAEBE|nr:hypothetical protein CAEBREN_14719 [Caenorhabditis brenneri]
MSTENVSPETSETSEVSEDSKMEQRRRSTTVIMTMNVTTVPTESGDGNGMRRNGSMRRRLSKQNATIEEPLSLLSISDTPSESSTENKSVPCIEEHPEGKEESDEKPVEKTDGMKLRPPGLAQKKIWSTSKSLSRESNGTEYSDRSGTDLRTFVDRTLHKSEEDRKQLLEFEKELRNLILDESVQSKKFELQSSYHRMLLHRVAAWFGLDHNVTNKQTDIVVNKSERTKIPDENFCDYIRHDNYVEDRFKRQNTGGSGRKELHHMESFGEPHSQYGSQYGSQTSLNHDLMMMRRAQSFDVPTGTPVMHSPPQRGVPIRQLSLNCPQQPMVGSPISGHHGHQWAPQRSFDCSNNSYLCTAKHPIMRKAESFGGMAMNGCYDQSVPVVCHTPPSVMVHQHHHHHHAHVPQQPAPNYTGYQMFEEMPMGSPNYQPEPGMCSPGGTYYEYVPQVVQPPPPPPQYTRPIRYMTHDYHQRRPQSTGVQYMYGPPQYVQYQPMVHPEVEVIVDPVQSQPFPPVGHFVVPTEDQQQGYSSTHQAETANSFIKASIDGGYGSMNQETDSSGNAEKIEEVTV